jgi:hypothetical protein
MSPSGRQLLIAVLTSVLLPRAAPVTAQTTNRIAVGMAIAGKQATGDEARGAFGPGFIWRFGTAKEGWHIKYGLNWYKAEISRSIDGDTFASGKLKVRPLMGGYGYTHLMGRTAASANVLGGYAFNAFASDAGSSLGTSVVTDVANTFVLKPEVSLWTDVSKKVGINFNVGYIVARPYITVEAPDTTDRHRLRADALTLTLGVVYSVF